MRVRNLLIWDGEKHLTIEKIILGMTIMTEVLGTDVLVVGGGMAGAYAAIQTAKQSVDVLLITKGLLGKSGCSVNAACFTRPDKYVPPDNMKNHLKALVAVGGGACVPLGNQEILKDIIEKGEEIVAELEEMGVYWRRFSDGSVVKCGSGLDNRGRIVQPRGIISPKYGITGKNIMDILRREVIRRGIHFLEEVTLTRLLTKNGRVVGATVLDYKNGDFFAIRAKAVILATGSGGYLWRRFSGSNEVTIEGHVLAFNAGAELIDLEIMTWHFADVAWPQAWRRLQMYPIPLPVTCDVPRWYNSKEERFMEKLETATKARQAMAAANQRGGYYASYKHIDPKLLDEYWAQLPFLKKLGIDVTKDLVECEMSAHSMHGGIRINKRCETNVVGLYVAGSASGVFYPTLFECGWGGITSAKYASSFVREIDETELNWKQVEKEEKRVIGMLHTKPRDGYSPAQIKTKIRNIMFDKVHYIKSERRLNEALSDLSRVEDDLVPKMRLESDTKRFNYEWVEALEVPDMVKAAELVIEFCRFRKETRGAFVREDYPETDNENWLKNIIGKIENGTMKLYTLPVKFPYVKREEIIKITETAIR